MSEAPARGRGHLRARGRHLRDREARRELLSLRACLRLEKQRTRDALEALERIVGEEYGASVRMARLQAMTAGLSGAATPAQVADVVLNEGLLALEAVAGNIALLSGDGVTLEIVGAVGYPASVVEPWRRFQLGVHVPIAEAARTGLPVFLESREAWLARYEHEPRSPGHEAWAAIPLRVEGRVLGACGLSFAAERAFPEGERAFMVTLAGLCAQALERARLFDAAIRARAEAERANQAKDEFLAVLSHELRTPLTAILGWLRILRIRPPDAVLLDRALTVMERNARAEASLVEDILDVSRIVAESLRLEATEIDLRDVVRATIDLVLPAAEAKGLVIEAQIAAEPLSICGDAARLQQVFSNVISNAVKFTPSGGRVEVEARAHEGAARVRVHDNGEGIIPEFLPHVFERFTQADISVTRAHGGLGLGLAIAKHLVGLHRGVITVESPGRGAGATFTILLPFAEGA